MFFGWKYITLTAIIAALLLIACAGSVPEMVQRQRVDIPGLEFPSFSWDKSRFLYLDSSGFPDSVVFFLPVGDEPLKIEDCQVIEDIRGWADNCEFDFIPYGITRNANIVIVEDISASMGDYVHFTDRLIWGYISILADRDCEVSLVRFGEDVRRTLPWMLPDSALGFVPESLDYPNSRGSQLSGALTEALDLVALRQSSPASIALFSDGDFPAKDIPYHIVERAKRYGVSINILLHGETSRGALAEIAKKTGGVYLVQPTGGFSPGMVAAILDQSYLVTYRPVHLDKDGILHKVSLLAPDSRRYRDEYRAPGIFVPMEIEPEPFVLPMSF